MLPNTSTKNNLSAAKLANEANLLAARLQTQRGYKPTEIDHQLILQSDLGWTTAQRPKFKRFAGGRTSLRGRRLFDWLANYPPLICSAYELF